MPARVAQIAKTRQSRNVLKVAKFKRDLAPLLNKGVVVWELNRAVHAGCGPAHVPVRKRGRSAAAGVGKIARCAPSRMPARVVELSDAKGEKAVVLEVGRQRGPIGERAAGAADAGLARLFGLAVGAAYVARHLGVQGATVAVVGPPGAARRRGARGAALRMPAGARLRPPDDFADPSARHRRPDNSVLVLQRTLSIPEMVDKVPHLHVAVGHRQS